MSTINAVLEPDADGTVHLPIPAELRGGKVQVTATVIALPRSEKSRLVATPAMVAERKRALNALRAAGGLKNVIPDASE